MHRIVALLLAFCSAYLVLVTFVRSTCSRDPTSKFFQRDHARLPTYSKYRIQQAVEYADLVGVKRPNASPATPPKLCVGIASVSRHNSSYLKSTIGSLQQGLTNAERKSLSFVVLLAHTDQKQHPEYDQPWLTNMADKLVSYDKGTEQYTTAKTMEEKHSHWVKSKFDYSIVMEECKKMGAPYTLMLEDDVVVLDGWRHRTIEALDTAVTKSEKANKKFLYLRLFYFEGLRGWNSESWRTYVRMSVGIEGCFLVLLLCIQRFSAIGRRVITRSIILLTGGVFIPLLIALFFVAGGNCTLPQRHGVDVISDHVCCGQGLVFSRSEVDPLLKALRDRRWTDVPTDTLIEDHAGVTGSLRWVLTPVVMQHIGSQSSYQPSRDVLLASDDIWNYDFEQNDPQKLANEHTSANMLGT